MIHNKLNAAMSGVVSSTLNEQSEDDIESAVSVEEQLLFVRRLLQTHATVDENGNVQLGGTSEEKSEIMKAIGGLGNSKITGDSNSSGVGFDPFARADAERNRRLGSSRIPDLLPKSRIFNVSVQKTDNNSRVITTVNIALKDKRKKYKGFNWLDLPIYRNFIKVSTMTIFKPDLHTSPLKGATITELVEQKGSRGAILPINDLDLPDDNRLSYSLGTGKELEKNLFTKFETQVGALLGEGRSIRIVRNGAQRNKLNHELLYEVAKVFFDVYKKYTDLQSIGPQKTKSLLNGSQSKVGGILLAEADLLARAFRLDPDRNMIEIKWLNDSSKIEIYFFNTLYCTVSCDTVGVGNLKIQNEVDALYNGFSNSYLTAKLGQSFEVPHSTTVEFALPENGSIDFMSHYSFVDLDFFQIEEEILDAGSNIFSVNSTWSTGGFSNVSKEMYPAFSTSPSRIVSVVGDRKLQDIFSYHFSDGSQYAGSLYYKDGTPVSLGDEPAKRVYGYKNIADLGSGNLSSLYIRRSANNKVDFIAEEITQPSKAAVQYNFGFVFGGTSSGSSLQDMDPDPNTNQRMLRDLMLRTGEYSTEQQRRDAINALTSQYQSRFTSGGEQYSGDMSYNDITGFDDPGWDDIYEDRTERSIEYTAPQVDNRDPEPEDSTEVRMIQRSLRAPLQDDADEY